ncbi:hypothetical protein ACTXT7_013707 [Hymenolepis weldensis]
MYSPVRTHKQQAMRVAIRFCNERELRSACKHRPLISNWSISVPTRCARTHVFAKACVNPLPQLARTRDSIGLHIVQLSQLILEIHFTSRTLYGERSPLLYPVKPWSTLVSLHYWYSISKKRARTGPLLIEQEANDVD